MGFFENSLGKPARHGHCLQVEGGEVVGRFDHLRLHSAFQPLLDTATLTPQAHEALLRARTTDGSPISPAQAFATPEVADDIVFLDRLCRTVHAFNFAAQADRADTLYLNVDGRHLLHIEEGMHGRTFEALAGHCGLAPGQIVLEILESGIADEHRLIEAVASYQARGFRIAIDDFGCSHSNFDRLWKLSPDIVKLDRGLIVQSAANPRARTILPKLIDILHDLGAQVVCEGIETAEQHALVADAGTDMVQGFLYARPHPRLKREMLAEARTPDAQWA
ncbi:MAG TPA: EAL domain-containing protein [Magnetospirillum sp.]|nr:EAL domain-containing protein [Magnetospirillum sp.]